MKKGLIALSAVIVFFACLLLIQGISNFSSHWQSYSECLDNKTTGALSSDSICQYQFNDIHLLLAPIALIGIAVWLVVVGWKAFLPKQHKANLMIPIIIAAIASVLTLALRGIVSFSNYLDCVRRCPTGACGGVTGTDPIYSCVFPMLEFMLPIAIIAAVVLMFIMSIRKMASIASAME